LLEPVGRYVDGARYAALPEFEVGPRVHEKESRSRVHELLHLLRAQGAYGPCRRLGRLDGACGGECRDEQNEHAHTGMAAHAINVANTAPIVTNIESRAVCG